MIERYKVSLMILMLLVGIWPSASALDIELESYCYFDPKSESTYIESYLRVHGSSVQFEEVEPQLLQAGVHITLTIEQGSEIVAFEKYTLSSPKSERVVDFMDIKRFGLSAGKYYVHLVAVDAHNDKNTIELKSLIEVNTSTEQRLSDILVLGKARMAESHESGPFVKQGVYMEPLSYGFLDDTVQQLPMYIEVYDPPERGYLKYGLYDMYTRAADPVLAKYKKLLADPVQASVLYLPIDKVISGSYEVRVELYDSNKQLVSSSRTSVSRRNVAYDKVYWANYNSDEVSGSFVDSVPASDLRYDLLSLIPVAKEPMLSMLGTVIDLRNESAQRQFLFRYWKEQAPDYPEVAYRSYRKVADLVHEMYDNNVGFGFQTDRGHLFLKYGKPNKSISIDTEPDAPPYEIWYYSKIEGGTSRQTDVRFIFYNPSLAGNDYQLLHSTCIGERNNPAWEVELYRSASPESQIGNSIDATEVEDGWNRRAKEYFNDY